MRFLYVLLMVQTSLMINCSDNIDQQAMNRQVQEFSEMLKQTKDPQVIQDYMQEHKNLVNSVLNISFGKDYSFERMWATPVSELIELHGDQEYFPQLMQSLLDAGFDINGMVYSHMYTPLYEPFLTSYAALECMMSKAQYIFFSNVKFLLEAGSQPYHRFIKDIVDRVARTQLESELNELVTLFKYAVDKGYALPVDILDVLVKKMASAVHEKNRSTLRSILDMLVNQDATYNAPTEQAFQELTECNKTLADDIRTYFTIKARIKRACLRSERCKKWKQRFEEFKAKFIKKDN